MTSGTLKTGDHLKELEHKSSLDSNLSKGESL